MREIIVSEFITLDGVIEDPGGADKTKHGGWSFQFGSGEEQGKYKYAELFASDALLLGRVTYQGFAVAWPTMQGTGPYGERMNSLPKYVVSNTLTEMTWNATPVKGDIAAEVTKLKQMAGQDILVFGSGKRLFPEGSEMKAFNLLETRDLGSGILLLTYQTQAKK